MESDKFITVVDNSTGETQVIIIDLANRNSVEKRAIKAEAAIMNPIQKILALRGESKRRAPRRQRHVALTRPQSLRHSTQPRRSCRSSTWSSAPRSSRTT